jgi:hypothetical protein
MLTRNRALFGLLAATLAANAGCDFDGSNTPPEETDFMLDASQPDAPSSPGADATPGAAHDAGNEAGVAEAAAEAAAGLDAALPLDAPSGADVGQAADTGMDVAVQTEEAGVDATVDTGADAGVDASPVIGVDAADSGAITTGSYPVAVTISGPSGPESGVPIVFHDPNGTQLGVVLTDTTGAASMVVPAGSMVTAIFGTPDQSMLISMAAVQPGDAISLVDPTPQEGTFSASPTIHLPDSAPPEGTNKYEFIVADGCTTQTSSDTSGASVDIGSTCSSSPKTATGLPWASPSRTTTPPGRTAVRRPTSRSRELSTARSGPKRSKRRRPLNPTGYSPPSRAFGRSPTA